MDLYVLIEPFYKDSLWCKNYLEGLKYEAGKNSIPLHFIDSPKLSSPNERRVCIVLGSTPFWMKKTTFSLEIQGILSILVNPDCSMTTNIVSQIHINYQEAMQTAATYLSDNRRLHTILFGINPFSTTDVLKAQAFREVFPHGKVCMNETSISQICSSFTERYPETDSVICSNELIAIALSLITDTNF
jgi:hypothetical protein